LKKLKILVIIQRSNGDVYFANTLIENLKNRFKSSKVDILVNSDTYKTACLFRKNLNKIIQFSYKEKEQKGFSYLYSFMRKIYKKYDLSINLTASDRSVLFCSLSAKKTISIVEKEMRKSWWKRLILTHYYHYRPNKHIIEETLFPLDVLDIPYSKQVKSPEINQQILKEVKKQIGNQKFFVFHPCAQYEYKIYPKKNRLILLNLLSDLNINIVVTGGSSRIDLEISDSIPHKSNIINMIGHTSIEEYCAISLLSEGYIGMDTLNMHIAASQNKRVFAIFGPTNPLKWSPWINCLESNPFINFPLQKKNHVALFQANLSCVSCGKSGCNDNNVKSECLHLIDPKIIFEEVKNCL